jgi:plasmid stabilization system protein ParE
MSFNLEWTEEALSTFEARIDYLKKHWTEKEISNFKKRVRNYLDTLIESPFIGKKPGKLKDVYQGLIIKQVSLIYRVKTQKQTIELLSFIDNRQNPQKSKKHSS